MAVDPARERGFAHPVFKSKQILAGVHLLGRFGQVHFFIFHPRAAKLFEKGRGLLMFRFDGGAQKFDLFKACNAAWDDLGPPHQSVIKTRFKWRGGMRQQVLSCEKGVIQGDIWEEIVHWAPYGPGPLSGWVWWRKREGETGRWVVFVHTNIATIELSKSSCTSCDLPNFFWMQMTQRDAVKLVQGGEENAADGEIESHADGIRGDEYIARSV